MYDKIKNLVVNDYFTPNIKAEVILDTLLTPYIEGIVKDQCGVDAFFVTKEMSVLDPDRNDDRGEKIDYILANQNAVYLVELKTTNGSIKPEQAERYLEHCWDQREGKCKTFGEVFGNKLLNIMRKKTGKNWGEAKEEEALEEQFKRILKKHGLNVADGSRAGQARELLRNNNLDSTDKYLYTMGQILDYLHTFPDRSLWDKPVSLLYITPRGSLPNETREKLLKYPQFYLHPEATDTVSLQAAAADLSRGDDLGKLLAGIINEIYGE